MIKALIFDLGGVILKHRKSVIMDILMELFPDSGKNAYEMWLKYRNRLYTGSMQSNEFLKSMLEATRSQMSVAEFESKWLESYKQSATEVDTKLLDFIKKLRRKYKVYLLTDTIAIHHSHNTGRFIYENFDQVFASSEEGLSKLDGKVAFLNLLRKTGFIAEDCIFIDDLEENVKTAESIGMKGIVYMNFDELRNCLEKMKINA